MRPNSASEISTAPEILVVGPILIGRTLVDCRSVTTPENGAPMSPGAPCRTFSATTEVTLTDVRTLTTRQKLAQAFALGEALGERFLVLELEQRRAVRLRNIAHRVDGQAALRVAAVDAVAE